MKMLPVHGMEVERLTLHHEQLSHLLRLPDADFKQASSDRSILGFLTTYAHRSTHPKDELATLLMEQLGPKVLRLLIRLERCVWESLFVITRIALLVEFLDQPHLVMKLLPLPPMAQSALLGSKLERVQALALMTNPDLGRIKSMVEATAQAACLYALASAPQGETAVLKQVAMSQEVRISLGRFFELPTEKDDFSRLLDDKSFVNTHLEAILYEDIMEEDEDEANEHDAKLLTAYGQDPGLFERTARNDPKRMALLARLKLTHEQLEGWAIMLKRTPRLQRLLTRHQQGLH